MTKTHKVNISIRIYLGLGGGTAILQCLANDSKCLQNQKIKTTIVRRDYVAACVWPYWKSCPHKVHLGACMGALSRNASKDLFQVVL